MTHPYTRKTHTTGMCKRPRIKPWSLPRGGTQGFLVEAQSILGEGRVEKKEKSRLVEKGSIMTSWVTCPTSVLLGAYHMGIEDTVTSSHNTGVTSAAIRWGERLSLTWKVLSVHWWNEWMCEHSSTCEGMNERKCVSWGCLWLGITAALFPPCHPRETWEWEAERCGSDSVRDCSEAKAADCPGEDQRDPEASSQEHQVERGLWVLQRRMGLRSPPWGFPRKPPRKLTGPQWGVPTHLSLSGACPSLRNFSSALLGK